MTPKRPTFPQPTKEPTTETPVLEARRIDKADTLREEAYLDAARLERYVTTLLKEGAYEEALRVSEKAKNKSPKNIKIEMLRSQAQIAYDEHQLNRAAQKTRLEKRALTPAKRSKLVDSQIRSLERLNKTNARQRICLRIENLLKDRTLKYRQRNRLNILSRRNACRQ